MNAVEMGQALKRMRKKRGWTLAELARRAGTSAPTVHRYESGWRRFEWFTLEKLATALGCRLDVNLKPVRAKEPGVSSRKAVDRIHRLFWDRPVRESDLDDYPEWVTQRVLEYGGLEDVSLLIRHFGRKRFLRIVSGLHFGQRKTRNFWQSMLELEGLRCTRKFSREEAEPY